jgi:hypothetical protein
VDSEASEGGDSDRWDCAAEEHRSASDATFARRWSAAEAVVAILVFVVNKRLNIVVKESEINATSALEKTTKQKRKERRGRPSCGTQHASCI